MNKPKVATELEARKRLGLLTDEEVAAFLGIKKGSLQCRRVRGDAPKSIKVGRLVLTEEAELARWMKRRPRVFASKREPAEAEAAA